MYNNTYYYSYNYGKSNCTDSCRCEAIAMTDVCLERLNYSTGLLFLLGATQLLVRSDMRLSEALSVSETELFGAELPIDFGCLESDCECLLGAQSVVRSSMVWMERDCLPEALLCVPGAEPSVGSGALQWPE